MPNITFATILLITPTQYLAQRQLRELIRPCRGIQLARIEKSMLLKALGAKYLSRYKSYSAPWIVNMEQANGQQITIRIDELTVETNKEITGKGKDQMGPFEITGKVNNQGFAEFEKKYTSGSNKPVTQFHGNFTNCYMSGNWVVKGQCTGKFDMKMEGAKPYALQSDNTKELIYLAFLEHNSRIHSVGILKSPSSPDKKFFILNGKIYSEGSGHKELVMKFCYPQHKEEDYYMGEMKTKDNLIVIEGTAETHLPGGLFGSKTQSSRKFTLLALPDMPTPPNASANFPGAMMDIPQGPMLFPPRPRGPSGDDIATQQPYGQGGPMFQGNLNAANFLYHQHMASQGGHNPQGFHPGGPQPPYNQHMPHQMPPQMHSPQPHPQGGTNYPPAQMSPIQNAPPPKPYQPNPPLPQPAKQSPDEYR